MRVKLLAVCALCLLIVNACREAGNSSPANNSQTTVGNASAAGGESISPAANESGTPDSRKFEPSDRSSNQPRNVSDFYKLLPQKYFPLEGCEPKKDKDCQQAKTDYLKNFGDVYDPQNGYISGGCDGAQSCLTMAVFKRPDGSYLVGVSTSFEMNQDDYFLDYRNGNWTEVSSKVVPEFSRKNMYKLPRYGTTVQVFAKKVIEKGKDYEISETGEKLYDLEWKDGKFTIKK